MKQAIFIALTLSFVTGLFVSSVLFAFGAWIIYEECRYVFQS